MKRNLIFTILLCFISAMAFAQLNLPEDKKLAASAKSHYALLTDKMKEKDYEAAHGALTYLLKNTPDLHESMYVHGINIYSKLEDEASGERKIELQDSIMTLYELRVEYFNNEKEVIDRKTTSAYKFYRNNGDKFPYLLELFDKNFELNSTEVGLSNLAAYMDVVYKNDSINSMTNDEVLDKYYNVMEALDTKEGDDIGKVRGVTTNLLAKTLGEDFDCEFIKSEMVPKMNDNSDVAKRIITLSLAKDCTSQDFFAKAAKIIIKENPDYGLIRVVAGKEVEQGNYDVAMDYYRQALTGTEDNTKKAKIYVDMAKLYQVKKDNPKAVEYVEKALAANSEMTKAYKILGDLYFNSFETCKGGKNIVKDRAVFLIAYDMYAKAGDNKSMANAKAQFPSISEIFEQDMKEDQSITVNCWINKSTKIRRRPE